jgi:predicted aldo/keto reductase-like oxidoreductase
LLHNQQAADWNVRMRPCMDVISEARDRGIIRSHGTSCHTPQALKTAAAEPWVDIDFARLNPAGLHMDSEPQTVISVLRQMKQAGKGVVGTIGSESRVEMEDNLRKIPAASVRG